HKKGEDAARAIVRQNKRGARHFGGQEVPRIADRGDPETERRMRAILFGRGSRLTEYVRGTEVVKRDLDKEPMGPEEKKKKPKGGGKEKQAKKETKKLAPKDTLGDGTKPPEKKGAKGSGAKGESRGKKTNFEGGTGEKKQDQAKGATTAASKTEGEGDVATK